jgi:hypothetical protein
MRNAFNTVKRHEVAAAVYREAECRHMHRFFDWSYGQPTPLILYDHADIQAVIMSEEGLRQGDPFASFGFALTVQPMYEGVPVVFLTSFLLLCLMI